VNQHQRTYLSVTNSAEILPVSLASCLAALFKRDLARLGQQINAFSDDAALWRPSEGMTNSAGNLVLHIEGNLREYVGRQLGGAPYARDRPREFASSAVPRDALAARIASLEHAIPSVIEQLTQAQLEMEYPEVVLERPLSTQQFLVHLYGHLNWHLGKIDSARRLLTGGGAIKLAGL
jgi:DinB family protein